MATSQKYLKQKTAFIVTNFDKKQLDRLLYFGSCMKLDSDQQMRLSKLIVYKFYLY